MAQVQLKQLELPGLWKAADALSVSSQRSFFLFKRIELGLLVLGAIFGLISTTFLGGVGPIASILTFLIVVVIQLVGLATKAESRWYDARAVAESIKSSAWQFAVGGEAFRISTPDVESQFKARLSAMLASVPKLDLPPAHVNDASITSSMAEVRSMPLLDRVDIYRRLRVNDQVNWYARKAKWNRNRRRLFNCLTLFVEILAVVIGLLRIINGLEVDLIGVFAAIAAGLVAWSQAKKYEFLAESYSVTSHEVLMVSETIKVPKSEVSWSQAVQDAEAAFSREHIMWHARRQSLGS